MKLIIGLGNPGKQYEKTRHNVGFMALDFYLRNKQVINCAGKFNAQICEMHEQYTTPDHAGGVVATSSERRGEIRKIFFVKPQAFMNLSGEVVREIADFYKIDVSKDILVIHDDKDLPFGTIRESKDSSSGGHNGVQNIIDELGTKDFSRVKIGVESREAESRIPTADFVLMNFKDEEMSVLDKEILPKVCGLIDRFLSSQT
jgi:PTH1 family peptidyl-tRNA hydrolase